MAYFSYAFDKTTLNLRHHYEHVFYKDTLDLNLDAWVLVCFYGIRVSRSVDSRMTVSDGFGIMFPFPAETHLHATYDYVPTNF